MSVNQMGYEQAAPILNTIVKQATGNQALTSVTPADFISVANTALAAGYDRVLNAISQLVGRTIFSVRPYNRKFSDLYMTDLEWGSIVRKLKMADVDWDNSMVFDLTDGQSIDQWIVKKPNVLQLNIYGQNVATLQYPSITREQLRSAFAGPSQLNNFISMISTTVESQKEQKSESVARMLIANFIAAKIDAQNGVIHALTEYNAETGGSFTATTIMAPANFPDFIYWLYARMETLAGLMSERSQMFQINVTGKPINQHTQRDNLKVKMYAPFMNAINARVKATTFNDSYLRDADTEAVNFWQSIQTPNAIKTTPTYLDVNGQVKTAAAEVNKNNIIGVMYDVDALGIINQLDDQLATPVNARGMYYNMFFHMSQKWFTDFTEKGLVICLD